jgi:hypothetical protein
LFGLITWQIAEHAEFFSFGTNDLTQMTFGYSRDDVGKFLPIYLGQGILQHDPFEVNIAPLVLLLFPSVTDMSIPCLLSILHVLLWPFDVPACSSKILSGNSRIQL